MLRILDRGPSLCDGLTRRDWLRIGSVGVGGLSLPQLLAQRSQASISLTPGKAKAIIIFGLVGGPPQHETWDPKPDAPAEIRGEFGQIPTRTPGLFVSELIPKTALLTEKIAVLRAVSTGDNAHSSSGYQMLTGVPHVPLSAESVTAKAPNFWPSFGSIVRYLKPNRGQLPSAVTIPEHIWNDGNFPWPGQDAGFLGQKHHPWLIHCDPADPAFAISDVNLPSDMPALRFQNRQSLLGQVNRHLDGLQRSHAVEGYDIHSQKAFELVSSTKVRQAFDIEREPRAVRERYGFNRFAQSCLLARKMVEAGVALVQVNWTRMKDQPNQGGWDTHEKNNEALKKHLMPIMDQCFSALLEDLSQRGLLDETLVVWFGEFGRTPRFNGRAGRDHWGSVFSLALAGGGIRGGVVHGASDKNGAYPADGRVEARDLHATMFHCLGYKPDTEMFDNLNRPLPITRGKVIESVI